MLVTLSYFCLLIVGMIVPSIAYHGLFNPKSLAFLVTGTLTALHFIFNHAKISLKLLTFFLLSLSFLLIWLCIGFFHDPTIMDARFDQFKLFLITLNIPVISLYLLNEKLITVNQILKTVIFSNMAYCTVKVVAVALHFLGVMNIWEMMEFCGFRLMRMAMFGDMQRLQSSLDLSTPFLLLFALLSTFPLRRFYILISLLSTLLAFSRFLLFVYLASVFLYFITLSCSRFLKASLLALLIALIGIQIVGVHHIETSIQKRLFSRANYQSDLIRKKQSDALLTGYQEAPLLGHGMGSYVEKLIRDQELKHSYEVQWLAFLMQFGLIGTLLLLIPLALIAFQYSFSRTHFAFFTLFLLWIASGLTNPFLISLQSGILYTLFFLAPKMFCFSENGALTYGSGHEKDCHHGRA